MQAFIFCLFFCRCLQLVPSHQNWHGERAAVTPLIHQREEMAVQYAAGCIVTALGTPKMLAARHNVLQRVLQRQDQLLNPGSPNPGKTWRLPWRKWDSQAPQTLLYKPNSWGIHSHAIFHFNLYLTSPKRWPHALTTVCLLLDYFCIVLVRTWLPETMRCSVL